MKKSFAKNPVVDAQVSPAPETEQAPSATTSTAIVPAQDKTLANPLASPPDMQGDGFRTDVRLPRINLIQKTSDSELVDTFGIGALVLNKEVKLSDGKTPVIVTAVRTMKDYIQKIEFDSNETAQVFLTLEEVNAAGGSTNFKDYKNGNFFQQRAHIQFAIAAPEGASETDLALFPYDYNGTAYAMALMTVASSAYTSAYKELATLRTTNKVMRNGLVFGQLELSASLKKKEAKSWYVPVVKYAGQNSDELVKFFLNI
jgi:hypothetical protein